MIDTKAIYQAGKRLDRAAEQARLALQSVRDGDAHAVSHLRADELAAAYRSLGEAREAWDKMVNAQIR